MTKDDLQGSLASVFAFLSKDKVSGEQWEQYTLALAEVNPGDLDDAVADLRKTYAFRSLPLPAEILRRCDEAKRKRVSTASAPTERETKADPREGEWKTFALPGIGSLKMHVLPDEHPALRRYSCGDCKDSGWAIGPVTEMGNQSVKRCQCFRTNPVLQRQRESQARYVKEQRHAKSE